MSASNGEEQRGNPSVSDEKRTRIREALDKNQSKNLSALTAESGFEDPQEVQETLYVLIDEGEVAFNLNQEFQLSDSP